MMVAQDRQKAQRKRRNLCPVDLVKLTYEPRPAYLQASLIERKYNSYFKLVLFWFSVTCCLANTEIFRLLPHVYYL